MVLFLYTCVSYTHYNKIDFIWDDVQVGISNKMPTVSANRSSTEKKTLQDILQDNIDSTRKQLTTERQRTFKHLFRSLDVLIWNGYDIPSVNELIDKYIETRSMEQIPQITCELGEFLKEEKKTLNDKLQIIHNADKIFKHAKKNSDLVVRRSKRIRHLTSLKSSIKNNELI